MLDESAIDLEGRIRNLCTVAPEFRSKLEYLLCDWEEKFIKHPPPPPATLAPVPSPALDPDSDKPDDPTRELAQFGAGCFWGVELAFQRVLGVVKTEVGFSQGHLHDPTFEQVYSGTTNHAEVVRVHFDPEVCSYSSLLSVFWSIPDLIYPHCKAIDKGKHYRSGIYYYNEGQCHLAMASKEAKRAELKEKEIEIETDKETEILPAKRFYRAEESHQQFLAKGGSRGFKQSAQKGCSIPIRWYG